MTRREWLARALAPVLVAAAALAIGVAFYAFARPLPALFLPAGWHRPLVHSLPALVSDALPTFVHALVMPLLTAALLRPLCRAGTFAVCASWCAVEISFEWAQHPRIGHALLDGLPAGERWNALLAPTANFLRTGTFDRIDVVAAVLGSLTACAILCRAFERHATTAGARHA